MGYYYKNMSMSGRNTCHLLMRILVDLGLADIKEFYTLISASPTGVATRRFRTRR